MKTWRIRLRPMSAWATPWHADSLFGAICWRWRWLWPESFDDMLAGFREPGNAPPFLLSDAFVENLLPLPAHAVPTTAMNDGSASPPKKRKPPLYIPETEFRVFVETGRTASLSVTSSPVAAGARLQSSIDRETGCAADGALFGTDISYLPENGPRCLTLFLRTEDHLDRLMQCFAALAHTGFGKKSSTGLGAFALVGDPEPCPWMDSSEDVNGFVSLSHFVPAPQDPHDGSWRLQVSHPKFHANMVSGVFKGVLARLTPGSSFRLSGAYRSWYGTMISIPRPEMQGALHYGLCFPVPAYIGEVVR